MFPSRDFGTSLSLMSDRRFLQITNEKKEGGFLKKRETLGFLPETGFLIRNIPDNHHHADVG